MPLTKVSFSMITGAAVNVLDFGAVDGADSTSAFIAAAATGKPVNMPQGEFILSAPVTFQSGLFGSGAGDVNASGKTKITLTATGQLIVGDWYCNWDGFEVRSAVNNKVMVSCPGKSYWTFTNFVINKIGAATGQVGIEFNTSTASIYFCRVDNFSLRVDYPVVISGSASVEVFNANKIGMSVAGNKWFDFLSAITVNAEVNACDTNEFGGYFESGVNILTFNGVALRQNRFRLVSDLVTRVWNSAVVMTPIDKNLWEILDESGNTSGGITFAGVFPQHQIFIGPASTKARATNSIAEPIANAVATIVTFDSEQFDTLSELSPGLGKFEPRNAGYYQVEGGCRSSEVAWAAAQLWQISVYKNGFEYATGDRNQGIAATVQKSSYVSALIYMNGTTDYIDLRILHNQGGTVNLNTTPTANYIQITRV